METVRAETKKEAFKNPYIDFNAEFPRYITEMAHEAGYDAYMTGSVFLKLTSYLDKLRNPKKYELIEEQREREKEAREKELEEKNKPRVDADGWEISDSDDQGDNSAWDNDEEEDVYDYGSIQIDLTNKLGKMDNVLKSVKNKTALVRTAFNCFDFVQNEQLSKKMDGVHVSYPSGTVIIKEDNVFSPHGKHIIEVIDDKSSFVVFEDFKGDINEIQVDDSDWKITPLSTYFEQE